MFYQTLSPTPFGFFDSDADFQSEADGLVKFVKRKLGDDILSVELTKKQIWACFEEATLEYGKIINEYQAKSQMATLMGTPTGSNHQNKYLHQSLDFFLRLSQPYAQEAAIGGGVHNTISGSLQLSKNIQDYDIYENLVDGNGNKIFSSSLNPGGKMKIYEIFHFSPQAAYRFFDTTSAINYLNNEFSFESFTPETVFYVLPTFEDVLRGGQLGLSNRVRRSNYSYRTSGTQIRIFPTPTQDLPPKLWFRVGFQSKPDEAAFNDPTIYGTNSLATVSFGNIQYKFINSIGRQWIREYTLALSREILGLVRSKFGTVPIPGGDLQLNGSDLISQAREDKEKMYTQLKELLETMTYDKMLETEASKVDNLMKVLKSVPVPMGKCIVIG
jgi:hypothetical protein